MNNIQTNTQTLNHTFAVVGWGVLLVWWGVSFLIDPITIGMSAMGTGLILLGVNAVRLSTGVPTNHSTTTWGIIALVWGALDHFLALSFGSSFAVLLIIFGIMTVVSLLTRSKDEE